MESRVRSRVLRAGDVRRARLILMLAEGHSWSAIERTLGCSWPTSNAGRSGRLYAVVVDAYSRLKKGDLLAARISIPGGHKMSVYGQSIGYYSQMLHVLQGFEAHLRRKGHANAKLQVGKTSGSSTWSLAPLRIGQRP